MNPTVPPRQQRLRRAFLKAAILLLSAGAALLAAEAAVRIAGLAPPTAAIDVTSPDSAYRLSDNPILGYELIPNRPGVNSAGQRDVEHAIEKPAGVRRVVPAPQTAQTPGRPLSDGMLALLAGVISLAAFLIRLVQPLGTAVLNMQLGYFAQYIIYFIFGIMTYRRDWLHTIPLKLGVRWFAGAIVLGIPLWLGLLVGGGAFEKGLEPFMGGVNWTSAGYAIWESFFSVAVSVGTLTLFRDRVKLADKLSNFLSSNSFAVYMFHPPLLVTVSLLLRPWQGHPLLKVLVAGVVATGVTFLLAQFVLRRVPLLKRVL